MNQSELVSVLTQLAENRSIFHSEADFQHAFAWKFHERHPKLRVRLEYPWKEEDKTECKKNRYIDFWAFLDSGHRLAIELKYKTCKLDILSAGETFHLKAQSAQDIARYDFWKDVERLEKICGREKNTTGYVIFLTNDSTYWVDKSRKRPTNQDAFRIHEGKETTGVLTWKRPSGTEKYRPDDIKLNGKYTPNWTNYSEIGTEGKKNCAFRYLLVKVEPQANAVS